MELTEKEHFEFNELSDQAKERARYKWREHCLLDDWWDHIYDDATAIGKLLGIEIGEQSNRTVSGRHINTPDISFDGLYDQDDNCSFSGVIWIHRMKEASARIFQETGSSNDRLIQLAEETERIYNKATIAWTARRLRGDESDTINDMRYDVSNHSHHFRSTVVAYEEDSWHDEFTEAVQSLVTNFADWIYDRLKKEYEHLNSNEAIDEQIKESEKLFDVHGSTV